MIHADVLIQWSDLMIQSNDSIQSNNPGFDNTTLNLILF